MINWVSEEELLDNGCRKIIKDQGTLEDEVADNRQDRHQLEFLNKHFLTCAIYIDQELK